MIFLAPNKLIINGLPYRTSKKKEYEIERIKLENKMKEEVKQTSKLVKALQSVKVFIIKQYSNLNLINHNILYQYNIS